jgi:hypothetical protein
MLEFQSVSQGYEWKQQLTKERFEGQEEGQRLHLMKNNGEKKIEFLGMNKCEEQKKRRT